MAFPKIAQAVARGGETEVAPVVLNSLGGVADVKDSDVRVTTDLRPCRPNHNTFSGDDRTIVAGMLIDRDDLGIGQQGSRPRVHPQRIASHDQRRAGHGPECQQSPLLVMAQARLAPNWPLVAGCQSAEISLRLLSPLVTSCISTDQVSMIRE